MTGRLETCLVCAAALSAGVVIGPRLRANPISEPSQKVLRTEAIAHGPGSESQTVQATISAPPAPAPPDLSAPAAPQAIAPFLTSREIATLAERCTPAEPTKVMSAIVRVESAGHPLRIGVNGPKRTFLDPKTSEEAVGLAARLIDGGASVDLGLAQINNRNLRWLGLSLEQAFDPCRNLAAAGVIMTRGYASALRISRPGQSILQTAYSLYNTGDPDRGLANGYVAKVERRVRIQ